MSIRLKILLGCFSLTLITICLCIYAQSGQRQIGRLATQIYDDTVMAVSYLRSAQNGVGRMEREIAQHGTLPSTVPHLQAIAADVRSDLDIARERAMTPAGKAAAAETSAALDALDAAIAAFDVSGILSGTDAMTTLVDRAVEIYAADGFRYRRNVVGIVDSMQRQMVSVGIFAVLAALGITVVLSRSIVPTLRYAVQLAQSIAAGRLDNDIKAGAGQSEPTQLLRALETMQTGIACNLNEIQLLLAEQKSNHANQLALQHAKLEVALDSMGQGLCMFDESDALLVANRRFCEMFGPPALGSMPDRVLGGGMAALLTSGESREQATRFHETSDGRTFAIDRRPVPTGGWVATFEDVTEQRTADAKLTHMARHDVLTGLANRLQLKEHTPSALVRACRNSGLAMLCLDLDRFKTVNDTLGHAAGDLLLQAVAERLRACTRKTDLVARLGGDEFAIVQEPLTHRDEAAALAQRLIDALSKPFEIDKQQVIIGTSVGIALSDGMTTTAENLLKCADVALYKAKSDGRGTFRFFEREMDAELQARRELELDLRRALRCSEFEVFYQPLMTPARGISGFEALVRWRHPTRGLISPATFVPLAEEIGLIGLIGGWVLQQAMKEAASWPGMLKVAVNLSPVQFKERMLVQQVTSALEISGLDPKRLELEITESVLMQEDQLALGMLHELRALGVRIAMDDCGTGYSSLSYLRRFPFDKIKIDQSFVQGMSDSSDCAAIVKAVIGLGRSLNMAINAEGVENVQQLQALQLEGCGEMQGYLFSRPEPADQIVHLLRKFGNATLDKNLQRAV